MFSVCPQYIDPFAEANADDSGAGSKEYVHIRVQQRNGRKSLTTVQGLKKEFSYNKILKDVKKEFCCNGTVVQDPELGQVCVDNLLSNNDLYLVAYVFVFVGYSTSRWSAEECFNLSSPGKLYLHLVMCVVIYLFFYFHLFLCLLFHSCVSRPMAYLRIFCVIWMCFKHRWSVFWQVICHLHIRDRI